MTTKDTCYGEAGAAFNLCLERGGTDCHAQYYAALQDITGQE